MLLDTYALTIAGRRPNNEDAVCARADLGLFIVADGMGGYEGGEVASSLAVEAIHELVRRTAGDADVTWPFAIDPARSSVENEVIVATRLAAERITQRRVGVLRSMGSTVAVLRVAGNRAIVAHVGDSRVYRLRRGEILQLTVDHSLLSQMIAAGMPPADIDSFQFRHVVTRALGTEYSEPEVHQYAIEPGDRFLLCSDGLSEVLEPDDIAELLGQPAELACRTLVDAAYAAGSRDNISAIVVAASESA